MSFWEITQLLKPNNLTIFWGGENGKLPYIILLVHKSILLGTISQLVIFIIVLIATATALPNINRDNSITTFVTIGFRSLALATKLWERKFTTSLGAGCRSGTWSRNLATNSILWGPFWVGGGPLQLDGFPSLHLQRHFHPLQHEQRKTFQASCCSDLSLDIPTLPNQWYVERV